MLKRLLGGAALVVGHPIVTGILEVALTLSSRWKRASLTGRKEATRTRTRPPDRNGNAVRTSSILPASEDP